MRVYALYERSRRILTFLAVCFLAEIAIMLRMYVNFSTTVIGKPKAILRPSLVMFDHAP